MKTELAQKFNEIATEAYEAFPEELGKLVVLLTPSSDMPVYVSPEIADQLTESAAGIKEAIKNLSDWMHDKGASGRATRNYNLAGTSVNLIMLDVNNTPGYYSEQYTKEMELIFNLDHEIGHHILKNGHSASARQLAESVADVYAMLRHIQRFGKNTGHAGAMAEQAACLLVACANTQHYTTDAVQKAVQISEEMDISNLSLHETAALADKIAVDCRLDDKILEKLSVAFLPVQKVYERQGMVDYALICNEALAVMKKHRHDPDIRKAGQQFLSYPVLKEFMQESARADIYWREALAFLGSPKANLSKKRSARGSSPSA